MLPDTVQNVLNTVQSDPGPFVWALLAVFEVYVRLRPTAKNLSLLSKLYKLVGLVLPNKNKDGGLHF